MDSPPCLQKRFSGRKLIDHPGQPVLCRTLSGKARFNETGETAPGCEMPDTLHRFVSAPKPQKREFHGNVRQGPVCTPALPGSVIRVCARQSANDINVTKS
jgi:hypothetical protein